MESPEHFMTLKQSCLDDGLLAPAFGGNLRITRKGRELVKLMAIADEDVASALREALHEPWLQRRAAFVPLHEFWQGG